MPFVSLLQPLPKRQTLGKTIHIVRYAQRRQRLSAKAMKQVTSIAARYAGPEHWLSLQSYSDSLKTGCLQ